MSPSVPEPTPGRYLDSCGTPYKATKREKTGWWLQKNPDITEAETAYPKTDFAAAVNAGRFTPQPETK